MTLHDLSKTVHPREFIWFVPFLCIALMALALLRPLPHFAVPAHSRTVVDAEGIHVQIEVPFRGIVLTWGAWAVDAYLENTRAPETVLKAGGPLDRTYFAEEIMSRIYPQVLKQDRLWDTAIGAESQRSKAEIETLFAFDPGAYLGNDGYFGMVPLLRRVGLPVLSLSWHENNWDEVDYSAARVETALIGHPERGEALIARYRQLYADLDQELHTSTLKSHPRVLIMGSYAGSLYIKSVGNDYDLYLPPAGVTNASEGWIGEQPDAERILAMDPDIIFLMASGQTPKEFMHDPRWRGLKVVQEKRVYRLPGNPDGGGLMGLIFQPVSVRWMAEIAHPDRLQPKTRQALRDRYLTEFDYRLTDDEIDAQLFINENKDSVGYERFNRNYRTSN